MQVSGRHGRSLWQSPRRRRSPESSIRPGALPEVHILARTRHIRNAQYLLDLGADEVISEEFESALEIFTRALQHYQIPEEEVVRIIERSKRLGNALFTRCTDPNQHQKIQNFETLFKETHVHTVQVETGSAAEGKTIADLDLKDRFGIREFGFRRGSMRFTQPDPALRLEAGDTLVFFIPMRRREKSSRFSLQGINNTWHG